MQYRGWTELVVNNLNQQFREGCEIVMREIPSFRTDRMISNGRKRLKTDTMYNLVVVVSSSGAN